MQRQALLDAITSGSLQVRVVIIGGGVHGAAALRVCALNQIPAILLERSDYAAETSSRSSKMAHGGLRYLENFDFKQVREGIKARDQLFNDAAHLCRPERFLIPIKHGDWWQRIKLSAGLSFYDLISAHPEWRHRWIARAQLDGPAFNASTPNLAGCFEYHDGLMQDTRIVIESIVDACARGGRCLNYAAVNSIVQSDSGARVEFTDRRSNLSYQIVCESVINCAGPWVADVGCSELTSLQSKLRYSRGVHLVFTTPWRDASLFLPLKEKSRYYFVWPHAAGTMVGTTEREVERAEYDPLPHEDEIAEILARLASDLPNLELNRQSLLFAFAGVRTLAIRGTVGASALVSRRHIWIQSGKILSLLGGKWTTANSTAYEGVARSAVTLGVSGKLRRLDGVKLPGSSTHGELSTLEQKLVSSGISSTHSARLISRYGISAARFIQHQHYRQELTPNLLRGELEVAFEQEHALTIDDFLRRRLGRELMPGHGLHELGFVGAYLRERGADSGVVDADSAAYRERISRVYELVGKRLTSPTPSSST